jgi:hypothetical protein
MLASIIRSDRSSKVKVVDQLQQEIEAMVARSKANYGSSGCHRVNRYSSSRRQVSQPTIGYSMQYAVQNTAAGTLGMGNVLTP